MTYLISCLASALGFDQSVDVSFEILALHESVAEVAVLLATVGREVFSDALLPESKLLLLISVPDIVLLCRI